MNLTVKLTVDALLRSLRGMAHDLAERVEVETPRRKPGRDTAFETAEGDDESRR